ncbi:hypothetical protein [Scytonema sp. PRP1]|uniref:hypothetical protein n=1 Tax=Scytonema sp. PRP1 TaxID=3120513 RepID=UPI00300D6FFE
MPSGYGHGYRLYRASSGGGTARLSAERPVRDTTNATCSTWGNPKTAVAHHQRFGSNWCGVSPGG